MIARVAVAGSAVVRRTPDTWKGSAPNGTYVQGRTLSASDSSRVSATTPMISPCDVNVSVGLGPVVWVMPSTMCSPIGFRPGKNLRAKAWLITTTGGVSPQSSADVKTRPFDNWIASARKYPDDTPARSVVGSCPGAAGGCPTTLNEVLAPNDLRAANGYALVTPTSIVPGKLRNRSMRFDANAFVCGSCS